MSPWTCQHHPLPIVPQPLSTEQMSFWPLLIRLPAPSLAGPPLTSAFPPMRRKLTSRQTQTLRWANAGGIALDRSPASPLILGAPDATPSPSHHPTHNPLTSGRCLRYKGATSELRLNGRF